MRAYAGVVLVQGSTKLAVNLYRGWVGENAIRCLRQHVLAYLRIARIAAPGPEARGVGAAMIVGEVEPIGGFVGSSFSEPLLQAGILLSVLAYIVHLDRWMAAAAFALFLPQLVFVPLMQGAINRRAGARVWVLRQLGVSTVDTRAASIERDMSDGKRIDRVLQLNMGIYKFKFSMNFLMNFCSHLQVVAALLIGGWMVHTDQLQVGGIVAFISAVGRLNDPWGDLVNYFRDLSIDPGEIRFGRRQDKPALRVLVHRSDRSENRIPSGSLTNRQGQCLFAISTSCSHRDRSR